MLYPNGEYYVGSIERGAVREGQGTHYYRNGDIYDGKFVENKRVGKSRVVFKDGSEFIGQFIDDQADGHGIFTDSKGNRYQSKVEDEKLKHEDVGYFLKGKQTH